MDWSLDCLPNVYARGGLVVEILLELVLLVFVLARVPIKWNRTRFPLIGNALRYAPRPQRHIPSGCSSRTEYALVGVDRGLSLAGNLMQDSVAT
jgi:hypothetical protein